MPDRARISKIMEPYISTNIFVPSDYIGAIMELCQEKRGIYTDLTYFDEENSEEFVGVTFGKFIVSNNGYYSETSLEITVRNKAEKQCSYYITIEAVDSNGARIETDMIYADRLGAGQEIYLKAFSVVEVVHQEEEMDLQGVLM